MPSWLRSISALVMVLAVSLVLAGCSKKESASPTGGAKGGGGDTKITKANWDKVKDGMSEKEVTDLLGTPSETKDIKGGKELTWQHSGSVCVVEMKEGKAKKGFAGFS